MPVTVKLYPDKPELRVSAEAQGILASRRDQYAMIGVSAGDVELPEVQLPWWNIDAGEWQIASLPPTLISILPPADAMPLPVAEDVEPVALSGDAVIVVQSQFWRRVSEGLAAVWAVTLFSLWWTRRPAKKPREAEQVPLHKQQSRMLKNARRAALAGDATGVKSALLSWGRLQWPQSSPRSVGDLANRVSEPLAAELKTLSGATYGPGGVSWDGDALAKALRSFTVLDVADDAGAQDLLPPLFPGSPT